MNQTLQSTHHTNTSNEKEAKKSGRKRKRIVKAEENLDGNDRKRKRIVTENSQKTRNESSTNTLSQPKKEKIRKSTKILQERILNEAPDRVFLPNEIVLCAIPGYAPWPARILQISGQTITIQFFGTGQM